MAKSLGAHVATTVGTANVEFAKGLGADLVIDYKTQDFAQIVKDYDLVLDTQGGETLMKSLAVLRTGGKAIGISGPPDVAFARRLKLNSVLQTVVKLLSSKVNKRAKSLGVNYEFLFVEANGAQLAHLAELIDTKKITPILGREYKFTDTPAALADLAAGKIGRGKAVVTINEQA